MLIATLHQCRSLIVVVAPLLFWWPFDRQSQGEFLVAAFAGRALLLTHATSSIWSSAAML
jgi:hypothetical protein